MLFFHVASTADWAAAHLDGTYAHSTRDMTLAEQGFIHCSRYFQVQQVLDRFYADYEGRLSLLTINPRRLTSPWRFDVVPGESLTYPHIYGPLNFSAVLETTPIVRLASGNLTHAWFLPGPIATSRLVLRAGTPADWPAYRRTLVDESLRRHLGGPIDDFEADKRRDDVSSKGCVAVERDGVVVGFLLLGFYRSGDFEMSFSFLPEHQRKGYAREAASTLADWVFAVFSHLPRLVAVTQQANVRSVALLRELNWTETDHFVEFGERQVMFALQNPRPQ
jgi:uncharacterized protein (DUF952 family)